MIFHESLLNENLSLEAVLEPIGILPKHPLLRDVLVAHNTVLVLLLLHFIGTMKTHRQMPTRQIDHNRLRILLHAEQTVTLKPFYVSIAGDWTVSIGVDAVMNAEKSLPLSELRTSYEKSYLLVE